MVLVELWPFCGPGVGSVVVMVLVALWPGCANVVAMLWSWYW